MSYKIGVIANFRKELKRLEKKFPSLKKEIFELGEKLSLNPKIGIPIKRNCYKIRISIASKGKGKSGGARVITFIYVKGKTVYLISIYDKSEKANITEQELTNFLKEIE